MAIAGLGTLLALRVLTLEDIYLQGSTLEDFFTSALEYSPRLRIAEEVAAEFDDADLATFGHKAPRASASGSVPSAAGRPAAQRQKT